jgi:hypothetical protein
METVRIRDPGLKKFGSGIRDKHPGSATLDSAHGSFKPLCSKSSLTRTDQLPHELPLPVSNLLKKIGDTRSIPFSVAGIPDPNLFHPGSKLFHSGSRIRFFSTPNPGSASKNLSF